jgi:hypothetical protein
MESPKVDFKFVANLPSRGCKKLAHKKPARKNCIAGWIVTTSTAESPEKVIHTALRAAKPAGYSKGPCPINPWSHGINPSLTI